MQPSFPAFASSGPDLASQVKTLQRENEQAKRSWMEYCTAHGSGMKDPSRHTTEFLSSFLDGFHNGTLPAPSVALEQPVNVDDNGGEDFETLVAKIKHGQRTSQNWKELWWAYCDCHQDGVRDPGRHEIASLRTFLEEFAPRVKVGAGDSASSRDLARPREYGSGSYPYGIGVSALAERVKQMQRRHESYKERWAWYCDTYGNGIRDPARHPPQFLQHYITMVEGGAPPTSNRAGPYGSASTSGYGGYPYGYGYPGMFPGYGSMAALMMYGAAMEQAAKEARKKKKKKSRKEETSENEDSKSEASVKSERSERSRSERSRSDRSERSEQSSDAASSDGS